MYNNISSINSKYIVRFIIKEHLRKKCYFKLVRESKKLQNILDISLNDYKEYHTQRFYRTEMEIIPIEKIETDIKYYFIKMYENKDYYHIYFGNDKDTQIKRNYITYKDKINKITIKIDKELKSLKGLFYNCEAIKEFKFTKFNRDDFTDISELFYGCINLEKIDFKKFKAKNLTNMNWLFSRCNSLKKLNISNIDTSNVTEMMCLFSGCYLLKKIEFNFNTQNVNNMKGMFYKCKSLQKIDVKNFDTKNVQDFSQMFYECINLCDLDIRNFKFSGNEIMVDNMFYKCNDVLKKSIKKQINGIGDDKDGKLIKEFKFDEVK